MEPADFDRLHPEVDTIEYAKLLSWWECGGHAPWRRVWNEGVDVTDQDSATWPAQWQPGWESRTRARRSRHG